MSGEETRLVLASREADQARRQLASTLGALQHRLRPATLADNAWSGMKDKGNALREEAVEAVKARPAVTAGGVVAALLLIARRPLLRALRTARRGNPNDVVTAKLDDDKKFDLTAPVVNRPKRKGAKS